MGLAVEKRLDLGSVHSYMAICCIVINIDFAIRIC
jgi:hypothetical protein